MREVDIVTPFGIRTRPESNRQVGVVLPRARRRQRIARLEHRRRLERSSQWKTTSWLSTIGSILRPFISDVYGALKWKPVVLAGPLQLRRRVVRRLSAVGEQLEAELRFGLLRRCHRVRTHWIRRFRRYRGSAGRSDARQTERASSIGLRAPCLPPGRLP